MANGGEGRWSVTCMKTTFEKCFYMLHNENALKEASMQSTEGGGSTDQKKTGNPNVKKPHAEWKMVTSQP
jgi:hypothetical protein